MAQLSFESVDTNKDGVITQNEALAVPGLDFASADKDNSHTLSHQEFDSRDGEDGPGRLDGGFRPQRARGEAPPSVGSFTR